MSDEKSDVIFAPWPARDRGDGEVRTKQDQPKIEPRRAVNIGARHVRVETRFVKRPDDRGNNQNREQNNCELERCKKTKERIFLPNWPRGRIRIGHAKIDIFRENGCAFKHEGGSAAPRAMLI